MAQDFRFRAKNNQKKTVSYFVSGKIKLEEVGADDNAALLFDLPVNSLITNAKVITHTAGTGPLKIACGTTEIVPNAAVNAAGVFEEVVSKLFETGGSVLLTNSSADYKKDKGVVRILVEYVELDRTTGEYTN